MGPAMIANSYGSSSQQPYTSYMSAPPSPPTDEVAKCSLPSISSLLGMTENGPSQHQPQQQQQSQPQHFQQAPQQHIAQPLTYKISGNQTGLPPTPPMQSDTSFDGRQSPSASSQYSVVSASQQSNFYYPSAISNDESIAQRPQIPVPRRAPHNVYSAFTPQTSSSYYSPITVHNPPQVSGLYYQRPLPQQFLPVGGMSIGPGSATNPWQHHHYISPSAAAAFPQSQDRYICATCNKAFSRPSSLRIHSHSHTGEKPFKCPHSGCGKAFSVRSNMKRHERGCHPFAESRDRPSHL